METIRTGVMDEIEPRHRKTHVKTQHHHLAMFANDHCMNTKLTSPTTIVKLITTIYFSMHALFDSYTG